MYSRVVVLGAGFGGLELTTMLSEVAGDRLDITLIDKNDAFVFGYSKLDVMFGGEPVEAVRLPYRRIVKPGVSVVQETVTAIDPHTRRVSTTGGTYDADVLVVALGADYDIAATPGLAEDGYEFYSVAGAATVGAMLPQFSSGRVVIGVASTPFKCPQAPSEAALLLHDYLRSRGVRDACEITLVMPLPVPLPPSREASEALLGAFAESGITFVGSRSVHALDPARHVAVLDDGSELPYELFLGVPRHRVPDAVAASGLAVDGWIPVDRNTLATEFPGVYAVGDVTSVGTPKAGVFAEGAAQALAQALISDLRGGDRPAPYGGVGSCLVEFGANRVGRVDVDFFAGSAPKGTFVGVSAALSAEKEHFGSSRRARWFGE